MGLPGGKWVAEGFLEGSQPGGLKGVIGEFIGGVGNRNYLFDFVEKEVHEGTCDPVGNTHYEENKFAQLK